MRQLGQAVAAKKVEPICIGYLVGRRAGRGMDPDRLLAAVDRALGPNARALIVSAFAHRRCFMCRGGLTACATCRGTGRAGEFACTNCDGLGVRPCQMCLGSDWSPVEDMPPELRAGVVARRVAHVTDHLDRLGKLPAPEAAGRSAPSRRRELTVKLLRLQGRLTVLTGQGAGDEAFIRRCRETSEHVDALLAALRQAPEAPLSDEPPAEQ